AIEAIRSGTPGRTLETLRRHRDGTLFDVAVKLSAIREADRRISGVSSIDRDMTERRRTERHLAADHAVTQVLAESTTLEHAVPGVLEAFCRTLRVEVAE